MNMRIVTITLFSLFRISGVVSFQVIPSTTTTKLTTTGRALVEVPLYATRRSFVEQAVVGVATASTAAILTLLPVVQPAAASGGATAGGAYLLSAKQRYNERVKAGVKGFLSIQTALKNSDIPTLRTYFNSEDVGNWIDLTSSGYLLANAFRTTSNKAPDALPSVKAWKKFAGEVEGMTKALKKKDLPGALDIYSTSALPSLDAYLAQVELPSASEI